MTDSAYYFSRTQFGFQIGDGGSDFWILAYNYKLQASRHAEIYHKDDQNAHSSRKPTDPGFSELLGTSLVMPLIVVDKYWSPTSAPPSASIRQANRLKFQILTFWFASLTICRNAPLRSSCCVRPAAACTCMFWKAEGQCFPTTVKILEKVQIFFENS